MKNLDREVLIVIRSVKERTLDLCISLLEEERNENNIFVINEFPFSKALYSSMEAGIKANKKWTMVIDADVLIAKGVLTKFLKIANTQNEKVFTIQSSMLDKYFGGVRVGGIKFYRTSFIPEALKYISVDENRPETHMIKSMHKNGYYNYITDVVCGIHDFEQYFEDIFRKGFTYGVKHDDVNSILESYWSRESENDSDFKILLAGLNIGRDFKGKLMLDKDEVKDEFENFMKKNKISEKKSEIDSFKNTKEISRFIKNFKSPKEYYEAIKILNSKGRMSLPKELIRSNSIISRLKIFRV